MKRYCNPFVVLFFLVAMLLPTFHLYAQDTIVKTITLSNVDILPSLRTDIANPGLTIEKTDSIQSSRYSAGTLTDLLGQNGITFLKSYGGGNLATTTIRGASASQTPLLWNGINLQSPTNGGLDLSLVPAIICDNVSLQNGGGSSGWGSGAIGGVIQTNNLLSANEGWKIKYVGQAGSFGEQNHGIKIGFSNSRFYADVRMYRQIAENNFTYRNLAKDSFPIDTMQNSYFFQQGMMGQVAWTTKSQKQLFVIRSWYQSSDRGIPPSMVEVNNDLRQKDEFSRTMGNWKLYLNKVELEIKSAVLTEYMDFYQGYNQPNSYTHSISLVNEVDGKIRISNKITNTIGVNDTWSKADVTQYVPITKQNRASVFDAVKFLPNENWNLVLNLREEELQGKITPLVGSIGAEYYGIKFITIKNSFSRNYRLPTFNDLYWQPGGNSDLKPEDSWNEDFAVVFKYKYKNVTIDYSVTAYYRITENWIQWSPSSANSAIWAPSNLKEVWSRGFEHRGKVNWIKNKFESTFIGGYDYVRATTEQSKVPNDVSIGKQLVYVPTNHFYTLLQISYLKYYIAYNHQFNGLRFTTTDHSTYLPAYDMAQLTIGKRVDFKNSFGDVFFRVNNLYNKEYQNIVWRPMPGRNFQVGITIDFNKKKKSKV
jgi:iron complex outermembrane receptor protein